MAEYVVAAILETAEKELAKVENISETITALKEKIDKQHHRLAESCRALSKKRARVARRLAREVEEHRWVESCSIKRILPDRLRVQVEEKVPAGLARHGDRLLLVDSQGAVIEEPPASEAWAGRFPLLTGFDEETAWEGHQGRVRKNLSLAEQLKSMEQTRDIPRVDRIDVTEKSNTTIYFAGREYPVLLGEDGYTEKLARYRLLEQTLEERHGGNLQYVDLRFHDRVIVKPLEGTGEEGRS